MSSRLELREETGRGGTCTVHRGALCGAHGTERTVAVKRLLPERRDDPASLDLFLREAKLSTRVSHPRLVHALELREQDGEYLLITEWIDGCTLDALRAPAAPGVVATIGQRVCEALAYLHGLDDGPVIHRDVSPSNVFVTRAGEVKLADLGIAHCVESPAESPRALTRGFGAPEQRTGGAIDGRADIYALGKTLETLTDDAALRAVIARATREDPAERFESAEAFGEALGQVFPPLEARALIPYVASRPPRPRPVLDSAVRSILGPAVTPAPLTAEAPSRRSKREPAPPPRARWLGVAPWAVAALLASVGLWLTTPTRVPPADSAPSARDAPSESSEPPDPSTRAAAKPAPESEAGPPRPEAPEPEPEAARTPSTRAATDAPSNPSAKTVPISVTGEPAEGFLTLGCTPWASVSLDGTPLGNTPLRRVRVPAGTHRLTFVHPPTEQSRDVTLELSEGKSLTVIVDLNRDEVKIR